jgi:hypothetical protein
MTRHRRMLCADVCRGRRTTFHCAFIQRWNKIKDGDNIKKITVPLGMSY